LIQWDEQTMMTGIPSVDIKHKEWVRQFNRFDVSVSEGRSKEYIHSLLTFMEDFAELHFRLEELNVEVKNTPAYLIHREEQERIRLIVQALHEGIDRYGVDSAEVATLKMDLEQWVRHHISHVDALLWAENKEGKRKKRMLISPEEKPDMV